MSFDYILGTSSVDWSKVDHLESKQLFIVKTQNGLVYTGTLRTVLSPGERPILIESSQASNQSVTLEHPKIISMTETSTSIRQRFDGQITSGISYSKGNQATQYNFSTSLDYVRERLAGEANYNSTLAASTGATVSTRNAVDLFSNRLLRRNNWFCSGVGGFLQSSEQGINLQTNLGGGIGRYLKNTDRTSIWLLGGLEWQNTRYSQTLGQQRTQNVAAALIKGQAKFFAFDKSNLTINGAVVPALTQTGRVYTNASATYYVKLFGGLNWNVAFYGNWDNQPPQHFSGSDYGITSGVGWSFGNR